MDGGPAFEGVEIDTSFLARVVSDHAEQAQLQALHSASRPSSVADPYEGTLLCRVTVGASPPRRVIVEFAGSDVSRPTRRAAPMGSDGAFVRVPGVRVARAQPTPVRIFNDLGGGDVVHIVPLGSLTLVAQAAFPWVATAAGLELSCVGVDPATSAAATATALREAEAAVAAFEAAPPPDLEAYARARGNWMNPPSDAANEAILELEKHMPFDDTRLEALRARRQAALDADAADVEARWEALFASAPRASEGSHPLGASGLTMTVVETPLCGPPRRQGRTPFDQCFVLVRVHNPTVSPVVLRTEFAEVRVAGDRQRLEVRLVAAEATHADVRATEPTSEPSMAPGDTLLALGPKVVREGRGGTQLRMRLGVYTGEQNLYLRVAPP